MATGTQGTNARKYTQHQTHYLAVDFTFADNGVAQPLGYAPAGATVIRSGCVVSTAFNAGSTNTLNIGTGADDDGFATLIALGTIGIIAADELATTNDAGPYAVDTLITATPVLTGTAATTGVGRAWVEYILADRA